MSCRRQAKSGHTVLELVRVTRGRKELFKIPEMKTISIYNGGSSIPADAEMKTSQCRHAVTGGRPAGGRPAGGRVNLDTLGIVASAVCLVHCLAMPFVMLAIPAVTAEMLASDYTHMVLAGAVTAFCLLAIVPGYMRHNNKAVLGLMLAGLALVLTATFLLHLLGHEGLELPIISVGNVLVVFAHVRNRRLLHASDTVDSVNP